MNSSLNNAVGIYVQLEGSNISYPLDNTELRLHIEHQQQTVVKIGETIFYSKVNIKQTAGELIIRIGDSLDIIHYKDTKQIKFNYRLSKSLRKAVVDLAFMNATMDAKGFCVNNTWYSIPDEIVNSYNREWGLTAIASMTEFVKVLDILNIEKDIEWEKLSKQEYSDLNTLVNVFLRNEFVYDLDDALSPVCVMEIQGIKLLLGVVRSEKFADAWEIYNVFEYPTRKDVQYRRTEDGAILPTSIYTMLNPEDYSMIDNINYETLPDTYKCLKDSNPMLVEIISRDLLIMLLAYDKHPNERLLLAVESLAKWILDDDSLPEFLYELCFINLMQVYKRKRNLTDEEKDAIYDIYETATQYDMRTASALLLDDYIGARRNYSKMEGNMQEYFKTLPIYRFWKSN